MRGVTIERVVVRRIRWRGTRAFESAAGAWDERESCLLELVDSEGVHGAGEAAPLPGLSPDTIDSCERALRGALRPGMAIASGATMVRAALDALGSTLASTPAARFAAETAYLDLVSRRAGVPLARMLATTFDLPRPSSSAALTSVLDGDTTRWAGALERALGRGLRCVKAKIGNPNWEHEKSALADLRRRAGDQVELRLDANRAWATCSVDELAARLDWCASLAPRWLEEPVAVSVARSEVLDVLDRSRTPIALDESLRWPAGDDQIRPLLARGAARALIVKPTIVGGTSRAVELAKMATGSGTTSVVSHALEGPIGFAALAELALAIGGSDAAGLDRHPMLAAWPTTCTPHLVENAVLARAHSGIGVSARDVLDAAAR